MNAIKTLARKIADYLTDPAGDLEPSFPMFRKNK